MCILFDYEAATIDHALAAGLLEGQGVRRGLTTVLPESVRLTPAGEDALFSWAEANREHPVNGNTARNIVKDVMGATA
jgi:hypothetical protein